MLHERRSRVVAMLLTLLLVSLVPLTAAVLPGRLRGGPPDRVHAVALSTQEIHLAWAAAPGAAGYLIRRDKADLTTVAADTLSYVDTTVQPATRYTYTVLAVNATGASSPVAHPTEVRTPGPPESRDTEPPSEPEDFTVTEQPGSVLLDWQAAIDDTDITGYVIYRDGQPLAVVDSATTSYRDTTATPDVTHTYTVEARDVANHRTRSDSRPGKRRLRDATPSAAGPSSETVMAPLAAAFATQLRRYPYLTDVVADGGVGYATLNWATDTSSTTGSATWGAVDTAGNCTPTTSVTATQTSLNVNSEAEYQWKAQLALTPNTQYCYRVFLAATDLLGNDPSPRFWTQVPLGATTPYSFVVLGDFGEVDSASNNPNQANVMSLIAASGARFALTVGDNSYPSGSQANYGDLVQVGPSLSGIFGPRFWTGPGRSIPLFLALGNHGMSSTATFHPHLLNWPQDQAVATSSGRYVRDTYCCLNGTTSAVYPSVWYAFDAGPARFYVLDAAWANSNVGTADLYQNDFDTHWAAGSPELTWLQADLQSHPRALKFAFFHFPIDSDQASENSDPFLQGDANNPRLEGLLAAHGVQIAFTGHAHLYQRNRKSDLGLITYVTGGGGAKLESIGGKGCGLLDVYGIGWSNTTSRGNACGDAPVPSSMAQVFHFLLVSVSGATVTVTPTNSLGQAFDVQTYTFGAADTSPPTAPANLTATPASATRVDLSWTASTDNVGVTGYSIARNGTTLASVGAQTTFSDTTVAASTTYTYTVQARDAAGNTSALSNQATATTPAAAPPPPATTPPTTLTFGPDADTYVSQTNAGATHGSLTTLQADNSARQVFLRFTVSGLPAGARVASAKLRLFATNGSPTGGTVNSFSNLTWSEAATTWNNRPTIDGPILATVGNAALNATVVVDVTSAITGNGTYSLAITSTSTDAVVYASKELATVANRPQLVLTLAP